MPVLAIELANIIGVKSADPERLPQNHSFHLISDRGIRHSLYADSAASLEKWISLFQTNCPTSETSSHLLFSAISKKGDSKVVITPAISTF